MNVIKTDFVNTIVKKHIFAHGQICCFVHLFFLPLLLLKPICNRIIIFSLFNQIHFNVQHISTDGFSPTLV